MKAFEFMTNSFYLLCGLLCLAISIFLVYAVIIAIIYTVKRCHPKRRK